MADTNHELNRICERAIEIFEQRLKEPDDETENKQCNGRFTMFTFRLAAAERLDVSPDIIEPTATTQRLVASANVRKIGSESFVYLPKVKGKRASRARK